jgi:AbrB family looped-hinge helix DNA binding protein
VAVPDGAGVHVRSLKLCSQRMTGRIGAKGQVVIPKAIRDRANLHPGDEVDIELRDGEIVLVARRQPGGLGGRFANSGMAARLLEDRVREPR